jgi:hypothetical protein
MYVSLATLASSYNRQGIRHMQTPPREFGFGNLQRVNSGPTRCLPLFSVPPRRPHPRISAAKVMSIAANFLQKQQKQRRCAEMAAEISDFDRLLQVLQVPARPVSAKPRARSGRIFEVYNLKRKRRCRLATESAGCHI